MVPVTGGMPLNHAIAIVLYKVSKLVSPVVAYVVVLLKSWGGLRQQVG